MNNLSLYQLLRRVLIPFYAILFILLFIPRVNAQEKPPKPIIIRVSTLQHLSFGSFVQTGSYGTVTVDHSGYRSATGNIILPNSSSIVTAALFEVEAIPGTLVHILNGAPVSLGGSNGGSLLLTIGDASTGTPFLTTGERSNVFIGGTLTVRSLLDNPAGEYSGMFQVTFIQQ